MRNRFASVVVVLVGLATVWQASTAPALANRHRAAYRQARWYTWHGPFYEAGWGTPVALVVPPTASMQTNWGWGVTNTRISRINHQFTRPYPGPGAGGGAFLPTPPWPSDTNQFGVYYVRGPW
ncbi:MAG: hypothetical protein A2W31_06705 [Planctomycetes bacterium RBG_16_64_10]|nr:MAG: hypothetical protein A2W31_06705 [Planctomycetes bacterium RBG_16_64_10]